MFRKKTSEKTAENIKKFLEIEAIHLREAASEKYDQDLNALDKIIISRRISQDDKQKKKKSIKRDFLDEVKDASQITHDYKYEKYLKGNRSGYRNSVSSNELYENSYGAQLIQEARLNLEKDVRINDQIIIKNKKREKDSSTDLDGTQIALIILAAIILVVFGFLTR